MKKSAHFVVWTCSKFTREEIEQITQGPLDVLANRHPEVKAKDDFKQKHPNYRNKTYYFCPNCTSLLYLSKERKKSSLIM